MATEPKAEKHYLAWTLLGVVVLVLSLLILWPYLPYQNEAARQISRVLRGYGLEPVSLKVESLTGTRAVLADIELGRTYPLSVGRISADYVLEEAKRGYVRQVEAENVILRLYRQAGSWMVGGLGSFVTDKPDANEKALPLTDPVWLRKNLPAKINLTRSKLEIHADEWRLDIPVEGKWQADKPLRMELRSDGISGAFGKTEMVTGVATLVASLDEKKQSWDGGLKINNIKLAGLPQEIPPLQLDGPVQLSAQKLNATLKFTDDKGAYNGEMVFNVPMENPGAGEVIIARLMLPWQGGMISTGGVQVPMTPGKTVRIPVSFQNVDLAALLTQSTAGKVQATGQISGKVPVVWHPDGHITLENGDAASVSGGNLSVAAEALPGGDNPQLADVRGALQNFHYTALKIHLLSDQVDKEKITMQLTVEGNSPDAFEGRPVKLTVNLTGDVMPLIQQSLLPMRDPNELLRGQ